MKNKRPISIDDQKISHPYTVPDGYFDRLEDDVLSKTINAGQKSKKFPLKVTWVKYLAAASVVLFFGLYIVFKSTKSTDTLKLSSVDESEMLEYAEGITLSSEDIMEVASIEDIEWIENNFNSEEDENETEEEIFEDIDYSEDLYDL